MATRRATSGGMRSQNQLAQNHVVNDPAPRDHVAMGEDLRHLLRTHGFEGLQVHPNTVERLEHRREQADLDRFEGTVDCHGGQRFPGRSFGSRREKERRQR